MGGEAWEQHFPGRKHVSSVVGLRVTHPLVENAGDILLEHQLRLDGKRALVMSRPATDEVKPRLEQMGFASRRVTINMCLTLGSSPTSGR